MPKLKSITKVDGKRYLSPVPTEKVFWSHDGSILKDMSELALALNRMSEETFAYHVNKEKNDFANWVKDVLSDDQLATQMYRLHDRNSTVALVGQRLTSLRG